MTDFRRDPYEKPCAWKVEDLKQDKSWRYNLDADDVRELEAALDGVKRRKLGVPDIGIGDFPLPGLREKLRDILNELESGRGVFLISGLPMERYSKQDAGTIFWGIGTHLGRSVAQNAYGDVLGHVRDVGKDWTTDMNARGYQTTLHLPFHNDSAMWSVCCASARPSRAASRASLARSQSTTR